MNSRRILTLKDHLIEQHPSHQNVAAIVIPGDVLQWCFGHAPQSFHISSQQLVDDEHDAPCQSQGPPRPAISANRPKGVMQR